MTTYPTEPTGANEIDLTNIFASNNVSKVEMSTGEILDGYNNDGETVTPLTSTPDSNKFNYFWYQVHNTLAWVVNYVKALYSNKLETSGGTLSGALAMGSNKVTGLADGTASTDAVNKGQLDTAVSGAMWLSEVKYLAYSTIPTLPSGVEVVNADGRALSRSTYSTLFALIGTTYGVGDGSTTFNIPNLLGKYVVGWDSVGSFDAGRSFGTNQKRENSKFTWRYDYANSQSKNWSTLYTASEDGLISAYSQIFSGSGNNTASLIINQKTYNFNYQYSTGDAHYSACSLVIPVSAGDTFQAIGGNVSNTLLFIPKIQTTNNSTATQTNIALYPVIRIK